MCRMWVCYHKRRHIPCSGGERSRPNHAGEPACSSVLPLYSQWRLTVPECDRILRCRASCSPRLCPLLRLIILTPWVCPSTLLHFEKTITQSCLGPLVLVAILYEAIGIIIAWVIKQFFWIPHRFRYGILVAGGWGNYGDIRESAARLPISSLASRGLYL